MPIATQLSMGEQRLDPSLWDSNISTIVLLIIKQHKLFLLLVVLFFLLHFYLSPLHKFGDIRLWNFSGMFPLLKRNVKSWSRQSIASMLYVIGNPCQIVHICM